MTLGDRDNVSWFPQYGQKNASKRCGPLEIALLNVMLETLGVMSTHTPFKRGYFQMPTNYLVGSAVHFGTLTALLV